MGYRKKYGNNKIIYTVLFLVCVVGFWVFENFYTPDTYSDPKGKGAQTSLPDYIVPSTTTGQIVSHDHFMLSYSEPHEQAEWVVYKLKKSDLTYDDRKRPYFIEDPKVKTKSADWRNYKGSGYDRGHLCPAGDRRFSEYAYNETFYTSNISPQDRDFNAGVWNRLEMQVRQWAKQHDKLFVITAGVLEDGLEEIGEEDVDVPRRYYKIIARGSEDELKVLAFLMEGKESSKSLKSFLVPVDVIEQQTEIDFFQELHDTQENTLEAKVNTTGWKF
jgi:endonuclease G